MIHRITASCRQWWVAGCSLALAALWCAAAWAAPVAGQASAAPLAPGGEWLSTVISRHGLWLGVLAVFLSGLALNLTPCVYPMIPVTLAFFSSQASGALRRTVALAFCYVIGISLSYSALGVVAAKTGGLLGAWLQHPTVLLGLAAVIVALALGMFGVYELRVPQALTNRLGQASSGAGGAFAMGMVVGLVAAPCIGPFVLGLMVVVSRLANPALGFLLFFILGLGMGLPYVVLGVAANRVGHLPKAGAWLIWSKKALGFVLFGFALYIVRPLLPERLIGAAISTLLLGAGAYLGWLEQSRSRGAVFIWFRRAVGILLTLAAVTLVWPKPHAAPALAWTPYSDAVFEQSLRAGRPVIVDVYADWCLPCVELDHVTFRQPKVQQALRAVAALRIDATRDVSDEAQALFTRYDIYGVPTVLFFDRTGTEQKDLRVLGFVPPEDVLERLRKLAQ